MRITTAVAANCVLGEGVTWDERTGEVVWVDIRGAAIHFFSPHDETHRVLPFAGMPAALALTAGTDLVVAADDALGYGWWPLKPIGRATG